MQTGNVKSSNMRKLDRIRVLGQMKKAEETVFYDYKN